MADHDHSYKHLFSHPELVRDLLLGFIKEQWVEKLDLNTLEKVNGSYEPVDLMYFRPISSLYEKFYPRNIKYMPVVKFFVCLDLERKSY